MTIKLETRLLIWKHYFELGNAIINLETWLLTCKLDYYLGNITFNLVTSVTSLRIGKWEWLGSRVKEFPKQNSHVFIWIWKKHCIFGWTYKRELWHHLRRGSRVISAIVFFSEQISDTLLRYECQTQYCTILKWSIMASSKNRCHHTQGSMERNQLSSNLTS